MTDPFDRPARPWDLFSKRLGKVETEVAAERMSICESCPMLKLGICQECHCIMALKTKLPNASCPLHKWEQVRVLDSEPVKIAVVIDGVVQDILQGDDRLMSLLASNPTLAVMPVSEPINVGDTHG